MSTTTVAGAPAIGLQTQPNEVEVDRLPVEGELPAWLAGSLLRTGPGRFEIGEQHLRHWFDGLAMLHRFSFADGEVSYAGRHLGSRAYRAANAKGRLAYTEFATDPCRALFARVHALFSTRALTDNANVNVAELGERMVAMTETAIPVEFDRATLAAAGAPYVAPGHLSSAHPHFERSSGAMLNHAVRLGPRSSYRFYSVDPATMKTKVIRSWSIAEPSYMHSFAITPRWLILAEYPFVVNPARALVRNRPYIENYRWKPERGSRFYLVDRDSGELRRGFETDAYFCFHHVNAYEEDGDVVLDLCAYEDPSLIEDLYLERLRAGAPITAATLRRFHLDPDSRSVRSETLSGANLELPRIDPARSERPYRYTWGVGVGDSGFYDHLVKIDVDDGAAIPWRQADAFPGEPVFVARPGGRGEDDGVLLSLVLDAASETSSLLVLDAADMTVLARAQAPHPIPFGFHGQFSASLETGPSNSG